jgi:LysM repeat protein
VATLALMQFLPRSPGPPAAAFGEDGPSPSRIVTSAPEGSPVPTMPPITPVPEPSPVSTASASTPATRTYRVRAGDNLRRIAARFGTTAAVIRELNGLPRRAPLRVGQILIVPLAP